MREYNRNVTVMREGVDVGVGQKKEDRISKHFSLSLFGSESLTQL